MPSAASIASTRPAATITPCPASKADSAPSRRDAEGDVRLVLDGGGARAHLAQRRKEARRDLMRADHPNALALDDRGDAREQPIVAAPKQLRESRPPA